MKLTEIEEKFLAEKQERQEMLQKLVCKARDELLPLEEKYDSLAGKANTIVDEMKVIGKKKQAIITDTNLFELKKELADIARDVTKLLKKRRK